MSGDASVMHKYIPVRHSASPDRVSFWPGSGLRHAHPYDGWEPSSGLPLVELMAICRALQRPLCKRP